ncbi:MAG TPA: hypothetical protein VFY03_09185 [Woeseiaceae bacterium]|nr:hypothetical protein [Woeseiaceae bacterium]
MKDFMPRNVLALVCLLVATGAAAQTAPHVVTIPLSRPGEPIFLEIDILSARIEVIGEDRDDAEFEITTVDSRRKIITPSGTKALTGGSFAFDIEEKDNEISVATDHRIEKVTVIARVPRRADLSLSTVNDGEIVVRNITGTLELGNANGPVTASGINGPVIAESINDTIDIGFASLPAEGVLSMESMNGDLIVRLPGNAGVELHLDSSEGEILSDFEVEVLPSTPVIEREDSGDGVSVRVENTIVARVNGGGPVVRLKTLNGDISILEAGD